MTEDEARTKWCPFAHVLGDARLQAFGGHPAVPVAIGPKNRTKDGEPNQACLCLASGCMAWRTRTYIEDGAASQLQVVGFCGLAGGPSAAVTVEALSNSGVQLHG